MPDEKQLIDRVRDYFQGNEYIEEKKMFGGLAFLVNGNMCVGADDSRLMARVGPERYDKALGDVYASIMNFTGRPIKGVIYLEPEAIETDKDLHSWIALCEKFTLSLPPKNKTPEPVSA